MLRRWESMRRINRVCTATAFLIALPIHAGESTPGWLDSWPHWRGPQCNGVAPRADPPVTWNASKNLKWKAPLSGRGSSTPIVWGDQVFILTAVPTERVANATEIPRPDPRFEKKTTPPVCYYRFVVMSFDRQTGKLQWQ